MKYAAKKERNAGHDGKRDGNTHRASRETSLHLYILTQVPGLPRRR